MSGPAWHPIELLLKKRGILPIDIQRIQNLKNTMKKRLNIRCTKDIIEKTCTLTLLNEFKEVGIIALKIP